MNGPLSPMSSRKLPCTCALGLVATMAWSCCKLPPDPRLDDGGARNRVCGLAETFHRPLAEACVACKQGHEAKCETYKQELMTCVGGRDGYGPVFLACMESCLKTEGACCTCQALWLEKNKPPCSFKYLDYELCILGGCESECT